MMRNKKAQHEMVGFVLIVIIVIIGLFIFLIFMISSKKLPQSDIANNLLSVLIKTTSPCALVYEPNYESVSDLFRSCYDDRKCSNLGRDACDVLNETLVNILDEVLNTQTKVSAYQLDIFEGNENDKVNIYHLISGSCNGSVVSSEPYNLRISSSNNLIVILKLCVV